MKSSTPLKRDRARPRPTGLTANEIARRDRMREAVAKWRDFPPGIPPKLVLKFEKQLRSGKTIADLVNPPSKSFLVPRSRFKKHCKLNPEWAASVQRLSRASVSQKIRAYTAFGCKTKFCVRGIHLMEGHNILKDKFGNRRCRACQNAAHGKPMTSETKNRLKAALERGATLGEILHGKPTGGGPKDLSLIITNPDKFYHERKIDPDFASFVDEHIAYSNSIGQTARHARDGAQVAPGEIMPTIVAVVRLKHRLRTMGDGKYARRLKRQDEKRYRRNSATAKEEA
jgi:hypothetical protein